MSFDTPSFAYSVLCVYLSVLLNLLEVGVLDVIVALGVVGVGLTSVGTAEALGACSGLCATLVHLCRGSLHHVVEVGDGSVDGSHVGSLVGVLELLESLLDARLLVCGDLITVVLEDSSRW